MNKSQRAAALVTIFLLGALIAASEGAVQGAQSALHTCGTVIVPCLFPFFVVSLLMNRLGVPLWLGGILQKPMALLFGVSGTGAGVFLLGILGGYPMGAAVIADLVQRGDLSKDEAGKLLAFCNNSGPAFLIGAVGIGIFRSSPAGLLLYVVHLLAAVVTGLFLSGTRLPDHTAQPVIITSANLSDALPAAMSKAAVQIVQICGYVIFFGAVAGILEDSGILARLYAPLNAYTPLTLQQGRALCMGLLESGCGIGAMAGAPMTPCALTVCSFITGFGGVSVWLQTAGVLQGTGISTVHHLKGRLCCGCIGAFFMYTISTLLL